MIDIGMIEKFIQFKNAYKGNAQEEVMKLLQSGKITQQQLNEAQNTAKLLQQALNK